MGFFFHCGLNVWKKKLASRTHLLNVNIFHLEKRRNQACLAYRKFSFSVRELNSRLSIASNCTTWSYTERCEFNSRTEKENFHGPGRPCFLLFPSEICSRLVDEYHSLVYSSHHSNKHLKKLYAIRRRKQNGGWKRKRTLSDFFVGFELIFKKLADPCVLLKGCRWWGFRLYH